MPLLPLDLILTVGSAIGAFVLALVVLSRNKWATGGVLFGLCALSLALWTSADWFLRMQGTALPFQILFWKLLFNVSVCFGPGLAIHLATHISHRGFRYSVPLVYLVGLGGCFAFVLGLGLSFFGAPLNESQSWLVGGAFLAFVAHVIAIFLVAIFLYPIIFSSREPLLERRRAAYGSIVLMLFLIAGSLQVMIGPIPTGLVLSALTSLFLLTSLAAFVRAAFLDIELGSLDPFLLLLTVFGILLLLRSRDAAEALVTLVGLIAVGAFGMFAIKTVGSEKRKRLLLEQANRELKMLEAAKSDFVDMVAHQLRTPLGGIRASSAMLSEGDYGSLPEKARTATRLIEDAATRLISLADTFLSMSRVEVGLYRTRRTATDVRKEICAVTDEMRISASAKHLTLECVVDPAVPSTVKIDADALRNALFNVIDNAIKYTDQGSVQVTAKHVGETLTVEICDTGLGMTSDELHDLFKKFHRGKTGRSHATDGTGLGLYVVRRLLEAAGGHITASSDGVGKGSVFCVVLPIDLD